MKVALVHDFLTQYGGAERVLEEFHAMFPEAPVFTIVYDQAKTFGCFEGWDIRTSFIQKLPGGIRHYKWFLGLMPMAVASFDLSDFDVVLSDASAYAKGVRVGDNQKHICYCHTPTRYLWQDRESYVNSLRYPVFVKWLVRPVLSWLKNWDFRAAQKVDQFIANSEEVRSRIKKYYKRGSELVYPPVDTNIFQPTNQPTRDFFLAVGRLEPYKRTEVLIEACLVQKQRLIVAGIGSELEHLKKIYDRPRIAFLGRVTDAKLLELYQNAKALVFAAREDAGMVVVESLACGTPVIAYEQGGALEFVNDDTGIRVKEQSAEAFARAIANFDSQKFQSQNLHKTAKRYSREVFSAAILGLLQKQYQSHVNRS